MQRFVEHLFRVQIKHLLVAAKLTHQFNSDIFVLPSSDKCCSSKRELAMLVQ